MLNNCVNNWGVLFLIKQERIFIFVKTLPLSSLYDQDLKKFFFNKGAIKVHDFRVPFKKTRLNF
jgi:hypothetical protein